MILRPPENPIALKVMRNIVIARTADLIRCNKLSVRLYNLWAQNKIYRKIAEPYHTDVLPINRCTRLRKFRPHIQ